MMNDKYIDSTIEALILASPEPLAARKIAQVVEKVTPSRVGVAVAQLNNRYMETGNSYRIREIAGGYQYYIMPEYVGFVEDLFARRRKLRLTRAALETAAIIAYKQPVTKSEIEHIRGVASDGVIQNLLEKSMLKIAGRAETVGKPLQYGTTDEFLKFFGLNSLTDLPKMSEIEELIATQESKNQTELELATPMSPALASKLNVADGTFDPESRQETDESIGSDEAVATVEADETTLDETLEEVAEDGSLETDAIETAEVEVTEEATSIEAEEAAETVEEFDSFEEIDEAEFDESTVVVKGEIMLGEGAHRLILKSGEENLSEDDDEYDDENEMIDTETVNRMAESTKARTDTETKTEETVSE